MSLVRIITRLSEYPTELVRDLRTRGFDVETCLPPSDEQEAADLQITLDQCSPEGMSESISRALEDLDVVIVANGHGKGGKVRSIGMVVLSSEDDFQTSRKTSVPIQFNEIYTALLHERAQARKPTATTIAANWESWWQKTLSAGNQQLSGTWKYVRTTGRNLGDLSARTVSEAAIWMKAKKSSWTRGLHPPLKAEPDLVPSMFSLSGEITEAADESTPTPQIENVTRIRPKRPSGIWKPIAVAAAAILAVTLWLHGAQSRLKADQTDSKEPSIQTVVPAVQVVQKIAKPDPTGTSKILAKSNTSVDDSFQEVVVRHFDQPAPRMLPKDGVKRHVVVD